ncbi:hypothetical protein L596_003826 [Steinernema carpocapsae]|uniref:Uncharacterized protein n=1 Tax=Steinernema carpocapsae TaxID=34508 RepID=A0A4V6I7X2_STECR|nr:hypothetical protein L596_003826 [Steinernema carpocapsae]
MLIFAIKVCQKAAQHAKKAMQRVFTSGMGRDTCVLPACTNCVWSKVFECYGGSDSKAAVLNTRFFHLRFTQ